MGETLSESNEKKWYVLRTISGKENKVKEYIELDVKNHHLDKLVSQVLIPTEKVYTIRGGKKVTKERSSMPGYVLVEVCLTAETQHHLRWTPNVLGFLSEKNGVPIPIRPAEANRLLGQVDTMQEMEEELLLVPYHVGDNVKVIFGPFTDFSGTIEEVNNEKKKLKVMVMIFGRKNPIELSFTQVEKE